MEVERRSCVVARGNDLHGREVQDPSGLFNASLEGNTRRAIDIHEGDKIDEQALKALIRAAVTLNKSRVKI